MTQQAPLLAAMDCLHRLGVVMILGLSLTFTIRRFETGQAASPAQ
jgi:hypothetical protein